MSANLLDEDVLAARSRDARQGRRVRALMLVAALLYVGVLLIAPLAGIVWSALKGGFGLVSSTLTQSDVIHAFYLTAVITVITVMVTTVFGVIVALVLTRDHFPGKRIVSALVDLPLAVSPIIVGLMAVLLFGTGGWFEPWFTAHGIQILGALPSMILVTIFVSIPFVIREVAPVLEELGMEEEQAAWTLGASKLQTFFRVTLPNIRWGMLYGIALSAARSLGEVGAVLIVSGLIQGRTETATLIIYRFFEQGHYAEGYIVAMILAFVSIAALVGIEVSKKRRLREGPE
jgi:sulfate/thiosulfate transport system permease protein